MIGSPPPTLAELPRTQDRLTFLYVEHCVVHKDDNALTFRDQKGTVRLPAASTLSVLFGPGTTVSHQAMALIGAVGGGVAWTGEAAVRLYASGRALARSNRLLKLQASLSTNGRRRLEVARAMYEMRFPDEDVSGLNMQQLRGREGARVRRIYREESERTGVDWQKRSYDPNAFEDADPVNQALSAANAALYGVAHAVTTSLGLSPGLGFVHEGTELCFVYDLADLYKAETSIPAAFDSVALGIEDIGGTTRRLMRDRMFESHVIQRSVKDIQVLLGATIEQEEMMADVLTLWDLHDEEAVAGVNYAGEG